MKSLINQTCADRRKIPKRHIDFPQQAQEVTFLVQTSGFKNLLLAVVYLQ
jgi:hypothetical protein